jgi:hypothetical protein
VKDGLREPTHRDIPSLLDETLGTYRPSQGQKRKWMSYRKVNLGEAIAIFEQTGVDVAGYAHTIDDSALEHIWRLHGPHGSQLHRGMLPLSAEDIHRIPEITAHPDRIENGGSTPAGVDTIRYFKRTNGWVFYLEEQRTGRKELAAKTMKKFDHEPKESDLA